MRRIEDTAVARACALADERAGRGAAAGRLDHEVVDALRTAGLFRLFLPAWLDGAEADLAEACSIIERVAEADGAAGWAVMIGAGPGWFAPHMPRPLAEEVFGPPDSVVAGSGALGTAVPIEDGLRVTGRWRWCSGAPWATWFTLGAAEEDAEVVLAVPAGEVALDPTGWDVRGLSATASWDVVLRDHPVPAARTFRFDPAGAGTGGGGAARVPFGAFAVASMAAVAVGLTRRALREFELLAQTKPGRTGGSLGADPAVADRYAEAAMEANAAAAWLREATAAVDRAAAAGPPPPAHLDAEVAGVHAVAAGARACARLWELSGMSVLPQTSALGRAIADCQAITQNVLVAPRRRADLGLRLLGTGPAD